MGTDAITAPEGFVIDEPLPAGFVLDTPSKVTKPKEVAYGDINTQYGAAEGAATLLSGAAGGVAAGYGGIAAALSKALGITDTDPAEVVRMIQEKLTYQPKSKVGQTTADVIGFIPEKMGEAGNYLGEKTAEATGSPALGAAVNAGFQVGAPLAVTKGASAAAAHRAKIVALEKPALDGIKAAQEAGFKLTPNEGKAGVVGRTIEGLSGSAKLQKAASAENALVVNDFIRRDVGLADDVPITREALSVQSEHAGKAYDVLRDIGDMQVDKLYSHGELGPKVTSTWRGTRGTDPKTTYTMTAEDAVESIKTLRSESKGYYNAWKRDANPETLKKAEARYTAADQLENLIERNLVRTGQPELLTDFRAARTQIAKIHQADKALNPETGNIDAMVYKRLHEKKAPLTGGALAVAKFATQFPKLVQTPTKIGHTGADFGDLGVALLRGSHSVVGDLASLTARHGARALTLTRPGQAALASPKTNYLTQVQASPATAAAESATFESERQRRLKYIKSLQ